MVYNSNYQSPLGNILIEADDTGLIALGFTEKSECKQRNLDNQITLECKRQLDEYFKGKRREFDLPIHWNGTSFQTQVWQALTTIPYGQTRCYQDIAIQLNNPKAVRAIGGANNKNKIAIIIPCHRVIGKNGKLVGYEGGIDKKEWLLRHEATY